MRQMNLFQSQSQEKLKAAAPLAERIRPATIDEFVGQGHLLGPNKVLDRLLRTKQLQSFILWGPPGCGKTTLAMLIAAKTDAHLVFLSAVMAGAREIRAAVDEAGSVWAKLKKRTWLFMDEIHRLNKAQQDTLLPHVENGTVLLLGATTENPSFEVIRPLLSRARTLVLEPLKPDDLRLIMHRALEDRERGLGNYPARLEKDAEDFLIAASGGDARVILNSLEAAVMTTPPSEEDGVRVIDLQTIHDIAQQGAVHYDKGGEEHFNLISALHKSVRGSDPDATLYWLARMLAGGEEPLYIARRLIRMASEDIGLADPMALLETTAAFQTYKVLGSPEGELALAQAAVYLALAPKSNSVYVAFGAAKDLAGKSGAAPVPMHLRNAPTALLKQLGYGKGYRYPHDYPEGWTPETYLPDDLVGTVLYRPAPRGWEGKRRDILEERREETRNRRGSE